MAIQNKISLARENGYTDDDIYKHLLSKAQSFGKTQSEFDSYLKEKGISLSIATPQKEGIVGKMVGTVAEKFGEKVLATAPPKQTRPTADYGFLGKTGQPSTGVIPKLPTIKDFAQPIKEIWKTAKVPAEKVREGGNIIVDAIQKLGGKDSEFKDVITPDYKLRFWSNFARDVGTEPMRILFDYASMSVEPETFVGSGVLKVAMKVPAIANVLTKNIKFLEKTIVGSIPKEEMSKVVGKPMAPGEFEKIIQDLPQDKKEWLFKTLVEKGDPIVAVRTELPFVQKIRKIMGLEKILPEVAGVKPPETVGVKYQEPTKPIERPLLAGKQAQEPPTQAPVEAGQAIDPTRGALPIEPTKTPIPSEKSGIPEIASSEEAIVYGNKIKGNQEAIELVRAENTRLRAIPLPPKEAGNEALTIHLKDVTHKAQMLNEVLDIAEGKNILKAPESIVKESEISREPAQETPGLKPITPEVKPEAKEGEKVTTIIKDKKTVLRQLDEAIEKAPSETPQQKLKRTNNGMPRTGVDISVIEGKTISFKIDGGFKIINTKEALSEFKQRIVKTPEKIIVGTEKTTAPKTSAIAGKKEIVRGLYTTEAEGVFTDGIIMVKGEPPAKAKTDVSRKTPVKKEYVDTVMKTQTEPADFQYYYADNYGYSGKSDHPIATFKGETNKVLFKAKDGYISYDQDRFNIIRNRYPDAKYGITKEGTLIAYDNGQPVAALMPMRGNGGIYSEGEPVIKVTESPKIQDAKTSETDIQESREYYDSLSLNAKVPTVVFIPNPEVTALDREFYDRITQIVDADLARVKLINFAKKFVGNIAEKQKKMGKGVKGYFAEPRLRYPYSNIIGQRIELEEKRIRSLNINDLKTLSHEVGHSIHSYLQGVGEHIDKFVAKNREEFIRCSQYVRPLIGEVPSGHLQYRKDWRELFADFNCLYLYHPEKLMEIAPNITKHIDNLMSKYNLQEAVEEVRNVNDLSADNHNPTKLGELMTDAFRSAINTSKESMEDLGTKFFNVIGTPFWRGMNNESFMPVYRAVFDNFVYKKNAVEMDFYESLNLEGFMKLPDVSRRRIVDAFFTGNMPNFKRYFSENELKANFQMNDLEIGEYKRIQKYMDKVVNELVVETAKLNSRYYKLTDPIEKENVESIIRSNIQRLGGYFPIHRDGSGKFKVYAEMGAETTFFNLYQTERDAIKAASELKIQGYTKVEVYKKKQVAQAALNKWNRLSLFQLQDLLGSEGIPKDNPIVKMIMAKLKAGKISFMLKREWIPGYEQNEDGFINSLASFTDTSIRHYIKAKAKSEAEAGMSKISSTKEPIMYDYANGYIEDAFKFNGAEFTTFHKLAYWNFLSMRASWLAVNLTQPFVMTAPYLTKELGLLNGTKAWGEAYRLLTQPKTGELGEIIERAKSEGLFRAYFTEYAMGTQMKKKPNEYGKIVQEVGKWFDYKNKPTYVKQQILALSKTIDRNFDSAMGIMGIIGERINREHATIAGYLSGKEKGLEGEELYAYIKKMLSVTQVDYGKINDPEFVRKSGIFHPILKLGYTFATFASSYHSFMYYLTKEGIGRTSKGWGKPKLNDVIGGGQAWFNAWLLAGLMGLPFGAGVLLNKAIRKTTKKEPWLEQRMNNQWMADLIWRGFPASNGWDMSRSAGQGEFLGRFGNLEDSALGVYKGWYKRMGYGFKNVSRGKIFEGIQNFSPLFMSNMVDVYRMTNEMRKGVPATVGGVALKGEPSTFELASKFLGFQPTRFSSQYSLTQYMRFLNSEMNRVSSKASSLFAEGVRLQDEELKEKGKKIVQDWNNGLPEDLREFRIKLSEQGIKIKLERELAGYSRYRKGIVKKGLEYQREAVK